MLAHLRAQGFSSKVVRAFAKVPREEFLPEHLRELAYLDTALPLDRNSTISQPSTIAFMLEKLELARKQKILEIGSGSGYVLALLAEITRGEIYGVEINEILARKSAETLKRLGYNAKVVHASGFDGLPSHAPFDRILASADFQEIPFHLVNQLKSKGIVVAPVGSAIVKLSRLNGKTKVERYEGFVFVPMEK